jgi:glycosyltransferase involved in cell wall biosynthesis
VIGQVGQLTPTKRPDFLISAFSQAIKTAPNLHLCIVGRGPLEAELRTMATTLGIADKVTMTGFVDDVLPFYQHVFDINALVSSEEGLGISILEGAACGLPSIISDCTGLSETTVHNVTGLAFSPEKESELIEAMVIYAKNETLRISAGKAARDFVERKLSLNKYMEGISTAVNAAIHASHP